VSGDPLRDELLRPPAEGWRPDPGDVLIGDVTAIDEGRGFAERPYPVVTVRTDEGEFVAFHAFHTVAREELGKLEPKVGDRLGVSYLGLVRKGDDSCYELYRMKLVPAGGDVAEPDWAAIAADAAAERGQLVEPVELEQASDDDIPF
jgi:hypothetical protein